MHNIQVHRTALWEDEASRGVNKYVIRIGIVIFLE